MSNDEAMTAESSPVDRTRVAAYALVRDGDGRILLCHIAPAVGIGDIWTLPGGGVDFGESPEQAVLRELSEETGLRGELGSLREVSDRLFTSPDGGDRLHAIRIVYDVDVNDGELRDESDGSTDACRWVAPDEAAALPLGELARRTLAALDRPD